MVDDGGENIFRRRTSAGSGEQSVVTGADVDMEGDSVETEEGPEPDRILFKVSTEMDYKTPAGGVVKEVNVGDAEADEALSPRDTGHNLPPIE